MSPSRYHEMSDEQFRGIAQREQALADSQRFAGRLALASELVADDDDLDAIPTIGVVLADLRRKSGLDY